MTSVLLEGLESRGRLGNQLWQIAACAGIAATIDGTPHISPSWSYRPWFSLPEEWYEPPSGKPIIADQWEGLSHIDPRARMYLQDLGLFVDIADQIREAFSPSDAAADILEADEAWKLVGMDGAWSLHVRRGDTVTQPKGYQPLATRGFYDRALKRVPHDAPVIVFSDDIRWCKNHIRRYGGRLLYVDHGNGRSHHRARYDRQPAMDWLDLQLMAHTLGHICSNSTYAWWGAWLAYDDAALYPSVWWGEKLAYIDSDLMIPSTWIEVPC